MCYVSDILTNSAAIFFLYVLSTPVSSFVNTSFENQLACALSEVPYSLTTQCNTNLRYLAKQTN